MPKQVVNHNSKRLSR